MRILFFITKSEAGGAQTHVSQLTRFLVEHGDEVMVMAAPLGWLEDEVRRLGARFIANPSMGNSINPFRLLRASRELLRAIDDFKPDLVACHSTMAGLIGRLAIRNRIPTVFTAHGWGFTQGAPLLRRLVLPILERLAARFCSRIIVVSKNDLELARRYSIAPSDKLALVHNGVETQGGIASVPLDSPGVPRNDTGRIEVVFVGRLAPPKDPFALVEALSRLPTDVCDRLRLTIVGDGPQMAALRQLIRDRQLQNRVMLTGALPRERLFDNLAQANAFILLSYWEGFPYTILEAMARGLPVIASNVGGIREVVDEEVGHLLRADNEDLGDALRDLVARPDVWRAKGERARQRVIADFSVEKMCQATLAVYEATRRVVQ